MLILVVLVLVLALLAATVSGESFFALVIDAGSTGSRAFVFEFGLDGSRRRTITSTKGKKVTPGLSTFADRPEESAEYLLPVFLDAAQHIPKHKQASTKVFVKGTAGMRLLPMDAQTKLWDTLYTGLDDNPQVPFILGRENFGTIDGYYEAYYAVLASNYVAGSINGNLRRILGTEMVGALDMGGSSTQLIFHTGTRSGEPVRDSDFWSHSWLNYGVDKVREKVWRYMVKRHGAKGGKRGEVAVVDNPCGFVGHEETLDDGYVLRGTGKAAECVEAIKAVLWPEGQCSGTPCFIDGVAHPPLQGEFYAMSVYFYAIDCIRQHGTKELAAWPNPTIDEVEEAVHAFCALDWPHAVQHMLADGRKHPYTRDEQLSHRCLEGLYMATLLEHGFGFHGTRRDITLALEVRGNEVEWTLGYALAEVPLPAPLNSDVYAREEVEMVATVGGSKEVPEPAAAETATDKSPAAPVQAAALPAATAAASIGALRSVIGTLIKGARERLQTIVNVAYSSVLLYFIFVY